MANEIRWRQRFQNFENAYHTLSRILKRYESTPDDEVVQMAMIQAFEFTFELAWNTMKDYLENEGFDDVKNSKKTIRTAFQAELIHDAEAGWKRYKNETSLTIPIIRRFSKRRLSRYNPSSFHWPERFTKN